MNWEAYWTSYPKQFEETDYLRQVKNTVAGYPVPESALNESIAMICCRLELSPDDTVLDLCCGNGLVTQELARKCRSIVGVDFSKTLIGIANRAHRAKNASYLCMNALKLTVPRSVNPGKFTKIVMVAGLQYFKKKELAQLMRIISENLAEQGAALLTAVPDRQRRMRFYDTPRRRLRWVWERAIGRDQMGTWWDMAMIEKICQVHEFECDFTNVAEIGDHYRFDVKITRKSCSAR